MPPSERSAVIKVAQRLRQTDGKNCYYRRLTLIITPTVTPIPILKPLRWWTVIPEVDD